MPQLLIVGAAVFGGLYAWKTFKREMKRVERDLEKARTKPKDTLERDPETGRYRLKNGREG